MSLLQPMTSRFELARASAAAGDRSQIARLTMAVLVVALCGAALFGLAWGASDASVWTLLRDWTGLGARDGALSARDRIIIHEIRLPRVVLGMLVGAALAVSGAVMQGLFRNPLADPGIVGVTAGAGLGAISVIVLGGTALAPVVALAGIYALPLAAFLGGLASTLILYRVATRAGRTSVATMLLAGIALGAMAGAFSGLMVYVADDRQLRDLTFWGLGSLGGRDLDKGAGGRADHRRSPSDRALHRPRAQRAGAGRSLGRPSRHSGSAAEECCDRDRGGGHRSGGRGVGRHRLRRHRRAAPAAPSDWAGPPHLLPASALLGATLLVLADSVSRTMVSPAELPIGIVTAAVGAPFFLWILLRRRGILDL